MKFDIAFEAVAICKKYDADINGETESLCTCNYTIVFDKNLAARFLLRLGPSVFELNNSKKTKVIFKYDAMNNLIGLCFKEDDYLYIVMNVNQFFSEILEGFTRIRTCEKLMSVMELDSTLNTEEIIEDFDE